MVFFLKKYSDSQCCWKKYSDFGGGKKKKTDSEFLSYVLKEQLGDILFISFVIASGEAIIFYFEWIV